MVRYNAVGDTFCILVNPHYLYPMSASHLYFLDFFRGIAACSHKYVCISLTKGHASHLYRVVVFQDIDAVVFCHTLC